SHVAFGATRVMATCGYAAQAVAVAAALCLRHQKMPAALYNESLLPKLQMQLIRTGQFIPGLLLDDADDLVQHSDIRSSSDLQFTGFSEEGYLLKTLSVSAAQMLPVRAGKIPVSKILVHAFERTVLKAALRISSRYGSFTPDVILKELDISVDQGAHYMELDFDTIIDKDQYIFICFQVNEQLQLAYSTQRVTGMVSVFNGINKAVSNHGKQEAPEGSAVDSFEFWCPQRRPEGHNLALQLDTVISFNADNIRNGVNRPTTQPNAWVADIADPEPALQLSWKAPQLIKKINLVFDTDTDHPMESVLMTHPETVMPFCVRNYYIEDDKGDKIYQKQGNFHTINEIILDEPVTTTKLKVVVAHPSEQVAASVFSIRCYA
ncbi:MAG TPA: FAD-dependent oxidoreductase, partial [Niabella sp.]|nr:FAD-dependent oxidoreductase [Niabella sp.]